MANTSSRTLRLLALLQNQRDWPGSVLADRLGVSERTVRRDVDRLRELGYPVEAQRGVDGGYRLAPGATLPPLVLDDEEAVALTVGLQSAVQSAAVIGIEESSLRALAKIAQVMPARLRRRVESLRAMTVPATWGGGGPGSGGPGVDPEVLTAVAQACRERDRIRFDYSAPGRDTADRVVDPHRLVLLGSRWYLVAYDRHRYDWRTFRLDRLRGPRTTGDRFHPHELPAEDAAAFVRAGIDGVQTLYDVEAVVDAPASIVTGHVGRWGAVSELDSRRCLLRMTSGSLDWPAMVLGSIGAEFEIRSPAELLPFLEEWGARFRRAAGGPGQPALTRPPSRPAR